jgi:hypothetical protein
MSDDQEKNAVAAGPFSMQGELELLKFDSENLRTFYSLSGPARKDFIVMMAEAEAAKVLAIAEAKAKGVLAMRKAEAEGYKLIGEALATLPNPGHVLEFARLHALERVAKAMAEGQATKMFLPQSMDGILGLLASISEVNTAGTTRAPAVTPLIHPEP